MKLQIKFNFFSTIFKDVLDCVVSSSSRLKRLKSKVAGKHFSQNSDTDEDDRSQLLRSLVQYFSQNKVQNLCFLKTGLIALVFLFSSKTFSSFEYEKRNFIVLISWESITQSHLREKKKKKRVE